VTNGATIGARAHQGGHRTDRERVQGSHRWRRLRPVVASAEVVYEGGLP
jgi:hypothetical protein